MVSNAEKAELLRYLERLDADARRRLFDFARELATPESSSRPAKQVLLEIADTISPEVADEIGRAIEEDCERVDPDHWPGPSL